MAMGTAISRDERGRFAPLATRSLRPHDDTPNGNVPPESNPGTVGPPTATGGDPDGVEVVLGEPAPPNPPSWLHASRWSGWPDEWFPPLFGPRVQELTDVAWACLDLNSSVLASMPPYLVGASSTLPSDWLNNPDPDQYASWADFARQLFWDFQLGEAFVVCTARYANGWPARFHLLPPWTVEVEWIAGERTYWVGRSLLDSRDVLHLRYQSTVDDAHGHGPLESGRARMLAAAVLLRYATQFAQAGGVPSSVLEHPEELTAKQAQDLRNQWVLARMEGMGVPAVMSGGVTWKATQVNPMQSALVDLAAWNEARVAVLLGVPPFLVGLPTGGDSMTYSNVSSIFDYHWRAGLKPKAQRVMWALSQWLLPRGTGVEVNRDEYIRPGPLERAQYYDILLRTGVVTVDEVREIERFSVQSPSIEGLTSGVLK